jgi:hypothetical protein
MRSEGLVRKFAIMHDFGTLEKNIGLFIGKESEKFTEDGVVLGFGLGIRGLWSILKKSQNKTIQNGRPCFTIRFE